MALRKPEPAQYAIRPAETGDLDEIARIERASFRIPWKREFFESELREPYRFTRVLDLVADGDFPSRRDEPRDVGIRALPRHPAHRRLDVGVAVPGGQRDPEKRRGLARVVEEHFVEVTHPVEQDGVGHPALHFEVLPEHRCDARRGRAHRGC